ncbi:MAG TPA: IniB N-terminal domain-containing protein [Amycolatopsis sp.]|uniref:IniB N-terminal domain-containing protein n=1 Tax=Amycolatopsis nalaikhensis TaxID=715472 RepID=A0ABY8XQ87_9PSEU|nr:IniB N-terminal domain-containing protein [Amycolatopsis sp. 2-2]WIV57768.1 IniB N-terminal domain-containing protein [Amycolatopsis sp. 2-2]
MDSVQTLHDFALNLLNDPTALAAFGTDPQGALAAAGLGDVSAADVHEVIPLVLDYVPVDSLPAVGGLPQAGDLSALGTDAPQAGIQGAIDQLTALTAGLGLPATPALPGVGDLGVGELPAVGDLPAVPGVGSLPGVNDITNAANVTALAGNATGALLGGDLANGLDSAALSNLTAAPAYLTDANQLAQVTTLAEQPLVGGVGTAHTVGTEVLGATAGPVGEVASHVGDLTGTVENLTGSVTHVGDFTGILQGAGDLASARSEGGEHHGGHGHGPLGEVTNVVSNATGINVDHNAVGQVGELASGNGSAVHDVVSDVADVSHNALGNLHIGDIASNNDIHIGH